jgi:hypothetical protein
MADDFDPSVERSIKDFQSPAETILPSYALLASYEFQQAIGDALQRFVDPSSPEFQDVATVLTVLKQSYATVKP